MMKSRWLRSLRFRLSVTVRPVGWRFRAADMLTGTEKVRVLLHVEISAALVVPDDKRTGSQGIFNFIILKGSERLFLFLGLQSNGFPLFARNHGSG